MGRESELDAWLRRYKNCLAKGKIGAICMNCNPMTNGHLYLIETAAHSVDFLYIFILEEDKSAFRFEDRIQLVRDAVAHLPNVNVIPSGKFIISTSTMPGYFDKKNLQETVVDSSYDLTLFAEYIAPELGISVRFAGEEPIDKFTAQYNYNMRKMFPLFGIEFVEIPRKMSGNEVISASKVRKLMGQNRWKEIRSIVPENVYRFLQGAE